MHRELARPGDHLDVLEMKMDAARRTGVMLWRASSLFVYHISSQPGWESRKMLSRGVQFTEAANSEQPPRARGCPPASSGHPRPANR